MTPGNGLFNCLNCPPVYCHDQEMTPNYLIIQIHTQYVMSPSYQSFTYLITQSIIILPIVPIHPHIALKKQLTYSIAYVVCCP